MLIVASVGFVLSSFLKVENSNIYSSICFAIYIIIFILLIHLSEKSNQRSYKKNIETYDIKLEILREVLKNDFKLYESNKVQELIKQSDTIIDKFKLSRDILNPILNLSKTVVFPIVTFSIGLDVKKVDFNLREIVIFTFLLIITIFMFLGVFFVLKTPIENYFDSISNKTINIKGMLIDIYIKDFIEDKK